MVWRLLWIGGLIAAAGCGRAADPGRVEEAGEPLLPARLEDALLRMESMLDTARAAGLDAGGVERLYRVEEISDRLLETETPWAWLKDEDYSVEARLRQIQSIADRIIARVRGNGRREDLDTDVSALQDRVRELREALAPGGRDAPVPIERILATLDSAKRQDGPPR